MRDIISSFHLLKLAARAGVWGRKAQAGGMAQAMPLRAILTGPKTLSGPCAERTLDSAERTYQFAPSIFLGAAQLTGRLTPRGLDNSPKGLFTLGAVIYTLRGEPVAPPSTNTGRQS